MKKLLLLFCIFFFVLSDLAFGEEKRLEDRYQSIDMAKVTCSEALQIKDSQIQKALIIWSDGYQSEKTGNTVVDIYTLEDLAAQLEMQCRANPSSLFIEAVQKSKKTKSVVSLLSKNRENKDRYSNIDMAKATCNDALEEKDRQALKAVLIWIDGYLSAKTGDTVVDAYQLQRLAERLESSCRANPSMLLMDAVKKIKKRPSRTEAGTKGVRHGQDERYTDIDMTKVTCGDVLQIKDPQMQKAVVIWLDGYESAKTGDTVVDVYKLQDLARRLEEYCRANPSTLLLKVLKKH
jgi:hypothetical protein